MNVKDTEAHEFLSVVVYAAPIYPPPPTVTGKLSSCLKPNAFVYRIDMRGDHTAIEDQNDPHTPSNARTHARTQPRMHALQSIYTLALSLIFFRSFIASTDGIKQPVPTLASN